MIAEGLVTTTDPDGTLHLSPMGPRWQPGEATMELRPFPSSRTYQNLLTHGEGVFHLTDDALLLARAALGEAGDVPAVAADTVRGFVLADCCWAAQFRVRRVDDSSERVRIIADVIAERAGRPWRGWNRARHLVLEAAVLATRFHLLNPDDIARRYDECDTIVSKTGGPDEVQAMAFLRERLTRYREGR